ncbi:hypothetical protein Tco_0396026 [Tanacetum coccineum]
MGAGQCTDKHLRILSECHHRGQQDGELYAKEKQKNSLSQSNHLHASPTNKSPPSLQRTLLEDNKPNLDARHTIGASQPTAAFWEQPNKNLKREGPGVSCNARWRIEIVILPLRVQKRSLGGTPEYWSTEQSYRGERNTTGGMRKDLLYRGGWLSDMRLYRAYWI